jgi:ribosome-associated toxin RatA of RatAB toxin-antitoxin module
VKSSIGIDVAAPAELVFILARDIARWPDLLPHYVSVRVVAPPRPDGSVLARMVARRPLVGVLGLGLPVTWQARTWAEPETLRLRFVHVAGATKGMDVTWRIDAVEGGCRISIEHDFRPGLTLFAEFVDRWFTRPIAGRTLATFKALAEALAPFHPATESERPVATNPPT